jgi:peptidoglycan/LPS O-acetylase OafA/YrhL
MKQRNSILLIAFLAIAAVALTIAPLFLYSEEPAWPFYLGAAFCAGLAGAVWMMNMDKSSIDRSRGGWGREEDRPV